MLELYHSINSVCAQKVRIALEEKGQTAKDHIMTLRGDQNEPGYLKLNPSGVVPTWFTTAADQRIVADPLLHRRGLSGAVPDAGSASGSGTACACTTSSSTNTCTTPAPF